MIDLRSDTCSRPTFEMRQAMANAEVGDDVYGDDPTVKNLERRTAALLGKEDAVYMPSGTMTNQVAIRTDTEPGDAVLFDQNAHVYLLEGGASSAFSGILPDSFPACVGFFPQGISMRRLVCRIPFFHRRSRLRQASMLGEHAQYRRRFDLATRSAGCCGGCRQTASPRSAS